VKDVRDLRGVMEREKAEQACYRAREADEADERRGGGRWLLRVARLGEEVPQAPDHHHRGTTRRQDNRAPRPSRTWRSSRRRRSSRRAASSWTC